MSESVYLEPLPPEAVARLDPVRQAIYELTEAALRELVKDPEIGPVLAQLRPDLVSNETQVKGGENTV